MNVDIKMIRMVWTLVENSNPYLLLKLSDHELRQKLLYEIERAFSISTEDSKKLAKYIGSRTVLIRDLAYSKVD